MSEPEETAATRTAMAKPRSVPVQEHTNLGRFSLLEQIGVGGMGQVYAAYDPELDRRIALKLLHDGGDDDHRRRLVREAQALARLDHPNVVTVHDVGVHRGTVFVAMEFVRGGTLKEWLANNPVDTATRSDEAIRLLLGAGRGLVAAHQADLVHRDIKPSNILIGDDGRARVADFGIARSLQWPSSQKPASPEPASENILLSTDDSETPLTRTGASVGTPAYMAPEQLEGRHVGAAADQFSYCLMAWEALFGVRPFDGDTIPERLAAIRRGELRRPEGIDVPANVEALLRRGMRARPGARHRHLGDLVDALDRHTRSEPKKPRRPIRRWALVLLVACAGGSVWAYHAGKSKQLCTGSTASFEEVWNHERRQSLRVLTASQRTEPHATERLEAELDNYASAWRAAHKEACESTRLRSQQSVEQMESRFACLERAKRSLDTRLTALLSGSGRLRSNDGPLLALPPIEPCASRRPTTTQMEQLQLYMLSRAEAQQHEGRPLKAMRIVEQLVENLDEETSAEVRARVLLSYGRGLARSSMNGASEALEEAYAVAQAAGHPRVAATAATQLAQYYALSHADAGRGRAWLDLARGTNTADSAPADPEFLLAEALLLALEGDDDAATRVFDRCLLLEHETPTRRLRATRLLAAHLARTDPERAVAMTLSAFESGQRSGVPREELAQLAEVAAAALSRVGKRGKAETYSQLAVEHASSTWGRDHIATSRYLARAARVRCDLFGERDEGTRLAERAVELHDPDSVTVARLQALEALETCIRWGPDPERAIAVSRERIALTIALHGPSSFRTAGARATYATTLLRNSDTAEARKQVSLVTTQPKEMPPGWGPEAAHELHRNLARAADQLALEPLAQKHATIALELNAGPRSVPFAKSDTCAARYILGDLNTALTDCRKALGISRTLDQPMRSAVLRYEIGEVLRALGRNDEALVEMQGALDAFIRMTAPRSADIARTRLGIATVLEDLGQHAFAEENYRESFDAMGSFAGLVHSRTEAGLGIARTATRQGRAAEALRLLEDLESEVSSTFPDDHADISAVRGFVLHTINPKKGHREYARAIEYYRFTNSPERIHAICTKAPTNTLGCEQFRASKALR